MYDMKIPVNSQALHLITPPSQNLNRTKQHSHSHINILHINMLTKPEALKISQVSNTQKSSLHELPYKYSLVYFRSLLGGNSLQMRLDHLEEQLGEGRIEPLCLDLGEPGRVQGRVEITVEAAAIKQKRPDATDSQKLLQDASYPVNVRVELLNVLQHVKLASLKETFRCQPY